MCEVCQNSALAGKLILQNDQIIHDGTSPTGCLHVNIAFCVRFNLDLQMEKLFL